MTECGFLQFATLITGAIVTVMLAFVSRGQRAAQLEAAEVKRTLIASNEVRDNKMETIHSLVNSTLGKELKEKLEALKELALIDPAKWQEQALSAQRQYDDHQRRQAIADGERPK